MSSQSEDATITRRGLTASYVVALLIVASMLLLAFLTVAWQLGKNEDDARLINVSGRQRMLSQRISLMASSLLDPSSDQSGIQLRTDFRDAVDLMQRSQDWLTGTVDGRTDSSHKISAPLQELYFGDAGVVTLVRAHLADANRLFTITESDHSIADAESIANEIRGRAVSHDLLGKLDCVVQQYESEAEEKLRQFWWLEFAFLMVGLSALAAEAIFIFRPMVRTVIQSVSELQNANQELVEFSYRISHDLRAPVLSSIGIAEITKDALDENDVDEAKESLSHICRALKRVSETSDDILQLTKMRMADVKKETFGLTQMIEESLEALSHMPGCENVAITTIVSTNDRVHAKRLFVKQSIENLISNAIKFQDPKISQARAEVSAQIDNGVCVISVTDNGLGIASNYRSRMFSMFQRFHPSVSGGSGLGLYLVKQNASALEGDLSYVPLEKGSRFTFSFPV
ncbi:Autoinducer 2 sensor kinase/phosphatase LuxQ [Rubripirellula lacrimiformis]|uniref:histidine kinase n=1 Tax=Rubripirellula lacrimiformis TaxID=1930273 RepID=A0A517N9Y9_9BACT|nr:ATP-binding protein [Rubripirellula lacrimiformis]QDT03953.1 Autoinducer 2 sensor kinase/phosphatase LuxQ [Rubripirellula lacrimiformis]